MPGASQRTAFCAALLIWASVAAAPALAADPAPVPGGPFPLPATGLGLGGAVGDIRAAPDGTAYVLTSSRPKITETVVVRHFGPGGVIGAPVVMSRGSFTADAALTPDGGALVTRQVTAKRVRRLEIVDVSPAGVSLATQRLTTAGRWLWTSGPQLGPTGAALLPVQERVGSRIVQSARFRPAGATAFGARMRLASSKAPTRNQLPDVIGDGIVDTDLRFALSPDGGAAVLALPDTKGVGRAYVRRISAAGVLGPRIDLGLGARRRVEGQLAYSPAGQLVVAIIATNTPGGNGEVLASILPAGATAAPAPQRLMAADRNTAQDHLLAIAAGPGDRAVVLASSGNGDRSRTRLFESTGGGAFAQTGTLPTIYPAGLHVFARPDGGVTAIWNAQAQDDFDDAGIYLASHPAGGAFSGPRRVSPAEIDGSYLELDDARLLADGTFAVTYANFFGNDGPSYLLFTQP